MKTLTKQMTWTELNDQTDDMLPDMLGAQWQDLVDDGAEDPIYNCGALEIIIDTLKEITKDTDCPEDYSKLISVLKGVR